MANERDALDGCGDTGCMIRRPRGVGTNGGCRCASPYDRSPQELGRLVRRLAHERTRMRAAILAHVDEARQGLQIIEPLITPGESDARDGMRRAVEALRAIEREVRGGR